MNLIRTDKFDSERKDIDFDITQNKSGDTKVYNAARKETTSKDVETQNCTVFN